jgi:hypothetical protein
MANYIIWCIMNKLTITKIIMFDGGRFELKRRLLSVTLVGVFVWVYVLQSYGIGFAASTTIVKNSKRNIKTGDNYILDYNAKIGYIKCTTKRAILWVTEDYLNKNEILALAKKVDVGIVKIEKYTGIKFDTHNYGTDKISYWISDFGGAGGGSYIEGQYYSKTAKKANIYLSWAKENVSPYLHEAVHAICFNCETLWIREGLAVYLNDKLGGDKTMPNGGRDLDQLSKKLAKPKYSVLLALIGKDGIPFSNFSESQDKAVFYCLSGSFVKFLDSKIGTKKLMIIYQATDTNNMLKKITNKDIKTWKKEWLNSL